MGKILYQPNLPRSICFSPKPVHRQVLRSRRTANTMFMQLTKIGIVSKYCGLNPFVLGKFYGTVILPIIFIINNNCIILTTPPKDLITL